MCGEISANLSHRFCPSEISYEWHDKIPSLELFHDSKVRLACEKTSHHAMAIVGGHQVFVRGRRVEAKEAAHSVVEGRTMLEKRVVYEANVLSIVVGQRPVMMQR